MNRIVIITASLSAAFCQISFSGCDTATSPQATANLDTPDHGHGHDHSDETGHEDHADHGHHQHVAPHGGRLIELGRDHRYHAEIVNRHADRTVNIYMLDGNLKGIKIDADIMQLTLFSNDTNETFDASPDRDSKGDAALFVIDNEIALEMIETKGMQGKIRVNLEGQPYTGSFNAHGNGHQH